MAPPRRRLLGTFLLVGIPTIVLLVALIGGGLLLKEYLVTSPNFLIKHVEVMTEGPVNKEELIRLADVPAGANLFAVSLPTIKKRIEQHPWMASVSVSRAIPDRLIIRYTPQVPVAIINTRTLRYVNSAGEAFVAVAPGDSLMYPLLQASAQVNSPELIRPALDLLDVVKTNSFISAEEISEISISESGTVSVVAPFPPKSISSKASRRLMTLQFGDQDIAQQWKRARATVKYLSSAGQIPRLVRLELGKKVIVKIVSN